MSDNASWREVLKPIIDRWELCAKLDMKFVEDSKGCAALAALVSQMAQIIDDEIASREVQKRCAHTP